MKKLAVLLTCMLFFVSLADAAQQEDTEQVQEEIIFAASPWPPYIEIAEDGALKGLYIELLEELFCKELGFKLTYLNVPWKRAQYELEKGGASVTITLPTKERLAYSIPTTRPLIEMSLHVFTYAGHPLLKDIGEISTPEDIKRLGLIPVTNIGNGWHKNEIDSHGIKTEYVPNEANSFQMIASRHADITIESLCAGNYLINNLGLQGKVVATRAAFGPLNFHILVSKKSKFAGRMAEINRALDKLIDSGKLGPIIERYKKTSELR